MQAILDLNIHPDKIVYANLYKQPSHLQYAANNGISLVTFDSTEELIKIKQCHPKARYVKSWEFYVPVIEKFIPASMVWHAITSKGAFIIYD